MLVKADRLDAFFMIKGRRYVSDGRLFLNASGGSVQGDFQGTMLSLRVYSEYEEKGRNAYVRLTVDGRTRRVRLPQGEKVLTVQAGAGVHRFEIVKLTESTNNSFALTEAETDGKFESERENSDLRIEFIGDSITTGFGVLCRETYGEYKTKEQDFTKAFPYLASKALHADYRVVAAGGWPIYKSKYAPYAIPDYYDNTDLLRNREAYDHTEYTPDVVVVTLGTNDFSYLANLEESERISEREEVCRHFIAFLYRLLNYYPVARIILLYGFFEYPDLGVLTEEVAKEIASPRIATLETRSAASFHDICAGHPGKRTHSYTAKLLVKTINRM